MNQGESLFTKLIEKEDPEEFAADIGSASETTLQEGSESGLASRLIAAIFTRMPRYFDSEQAEGVGGVVHWKINPPSTPTAEAVEWQVAVDAGDCAVSDQLTQQPTVSFEIDTVAFLRLVAGVTTGMDLMLKRRLVVRGDVQFALLVERLFTVGQEREPA